MLSIVMPCLNEAADIAEALVALRPLRRRGVEVIVVDGGSRDGTASLARPHADLVLEAPRGRARQMNAGAARATGDILLFLHADTRLPPDADLLLGNAIGTRRLAWGRFDVRIEGRHPFLCIIAALMNARSRFTGIATGDQAIFVTRAAFEEAGGYREIPLMEDVELSRRLRRRAAPICLRAKVTTSGRRWEKNGVARTILLMWRLRLAYWRGADPASLAVRYERR